MTSFDPPKYIKRVLKRLTESGYAAYLVGGCVRDAIIGRHVHDWDIATSASPCDVERLFRKTFKTGEKFGTTTVLSFGGKVEVTTFRTEGEYLDGRRPENVEFVTSLDEDLSRRDFTMNAMAVSGGGALVDPFGGLSDIEIRVIRCVGDPDTRFGEDALRMFRAYRFNAELGFSIEPETARAIYANAGKAKLISAERVRVELEKTLLSQRPQVAGEMIGAGLLDGYSADATGRPNTGVLDRIAYLPAEPGLRWCAFCAILLEVGFIESAARFLRDLKLDRKTIKACSVALSIGELPDSRAGVKRQMAKHGAAAVRCAAAAHDILQDKRQHKGTEHRGTVLLCSLTNTTEPSPCVPSPCVASCLAVVEEIINSGECFSLRDLAVKGADLTALGHPPGKELGQTLERLLEHVIEHPGDNTREALLRLL